MSATGVVLAALLLAAVLFALYAFGGGRSSAPAPPSVDGQVIEQLRRAGSDLSKPHAIDFFLYFPTDTQAQAAAAEPALREFAPNVSRAARGTRWLVQLNAAMLPEEARLSALRAQLDALARRHGGEYDGWGSPVVP